MGQLFMGLGLVVALAAFAEMYAIYGLLVAAARPLLGARLMGWLSIWIIYPFFPTGIALPYLLYPDGRLPSRRWRPVAWLAVITMVANTLVEMVIPGPVGIYINDQPIILPMANPTALVLPPSLVEGLGFGWLLALFTMAAAMVAPISRFRRSRGNERRQLKWFVYFGGFTVLLFPMAFVAGPDFGDVFILLAIVVLPWSTAIAIVRHQLYDIDLIIKRTLVYGGLTLLLALVYFGSVALLQALFTSVSGQRSAAAIVLSTLLIAALFSPLRRRLQLLIDRRFYRQKYDAAQILAAFARTAREEVDLERLTAELLRVVEGTMQPEHASLWLRDDTRPG
jgi:hypothetical protein